MADRVHPDCDHCEHVSQTRKGLVTLSFTVRSTSSDMPSPGGIVDGLLEILPREWFTPEYGADWWVSSIVPMSAVNLPPDPDGVTIQGS